MSAFYDGKYDVLLSTTIVESGLDIPTANTLIVHRADMFGLAQLYQLRGRVGRSKTRAYALFTLPANRRITPQAERRLKVLQSLDTLGAGFQLASHDLDIRGAGNLLGEEQSGHIKEVGFELYQQMLEEAVASLKAGIAEPVADRWSPQITIGTPVLIPEDYVADLSVRLALYRRLADLEDEREIDAFAAELVDRFGPLPDEVEHLLEIVAIKALCRRANVAKIDAGPKGAVISFRDDRFANPEGLVAYIREQGPARARAARHEGGVVRGLGAAGGAAQGRGGDPARPGARSPSGRRRREPLRPRRLAAESRLARPHDGLRTAVDPELAEDGRHPVAHRLLADAEPPADRAVVEAGGHQLDHLKLARGQRLAGPQPRRGRAPAAGPAGSRRARRRIAPRRARYRPPSDCGCRAPRTARPE